MALSFAETDEQLVLFYGVGVSHPFLVGEKINYVHETIDTLTITEIEETPSFWTDG